MGSTRLPGKILQPIAGLPLLGHIVGRLGNLRHKARIVVATSEAQRDDVILAFCAERGVDCFRGSEDDVLARYYRCAREWNLDPVVRLTADNPFTDIEELDRLIDLHVNAGYDFSCSFDELPVGVGAEIFSFVALERCFLEGHAPHHREHVDEYILENRQAFSIGYLNAPEAKRHPELRLTVDTEEDLRRARYIAERAEGAFTTTAEAIRLCSHFA